MTSPKPTGLTPELSFVLLALKSSGGGGDFVMVRGVFCCTQDTVSAVTVVVKISGSVHKAQRNVICLSFPKTLGFPCV